MLTQAHGSSFAFGEQNYLNIAGTNNSRIAAVQAAKDDDESPIKTDDADEFETERKVALHFETALNAV